MGFLALQLNPLCWSTSSCRWSATGFVEVFDEHDFVLALVVDQFVSDSADQHEAEPSRAKSLLFAHGMMVDRTCHVINGCM